MCGICGVVTAGIPPRREVLADMVATMHHRGPEASGLLIDRAAALGHARLAIIDAVGGAQPLSNEDRTLWLSFNGEIFNYVELAEQLRALGHRFATASDSEVIVHAWEQWGPGCLTRFNGQWAFALWDTRSERLVLARDRVGICPLFYARLADRLVFASQVAALFADPQVPRALDPDGLDQVFSYWSTVAPATVFRGIDQLPPAHYAVLQAGELNVVRYWTDRFPPAGSEPGQDLTENAALLRERLVQASRLRFQRADVPVGAYLSGGIDSSVIAAVLAGYTQAPLSTFSLRFEDADFDESRHQHEMVERLGTEHHEIVVRTRQIAEIFPQVVQQAETVLLRAAPAPLLLLSELVHQKGFKVVVTGEGADEVLGGYDIYREARVRQFWARDPDSAMRSRAAELLYPWMARGPGAAPPFARGFFAMNLDGADPALSHRPRWESTAALKYLLTTPWRRAAPGPADPARLADALPAGSGGWDALARAQWLEMTTVLPGYILSSQGDRMLMANSVEGRFPFLDPDVVSFANALPARHKLFGLDEKHLLKLAFADLVPPSILHRAKQPYRSPDATSFFPDRGEPDWIGEVSSPSALRKTGVFEPAAVKGLFDKCRAARGRRLGNTDNMRVLGVLSTQLLCHGLLASTRRPRPSGQSPMSVITLTPKESPHD
ncbi:asparagine synthase (glutamine-hydrolysing) [Propionibacterium cyclohexanicum]|uniref:asparagine synthase (glutamine-hydrolyzing) n=1 Tax=Propionibacterium cyclohexanicum TaxID=64702 RepID=A0A1H9TSU9_9ACTN|nr:asparagine synthase (glutamine-hydrolyzing) [Propionibacterium cyclohexanicum]SES00390.1 asparagine synthase (glutamine-hydrolysing) [Propionibacterium cyclohexanicum]